ncbi:MAG: UvrD-helicase domain-containing protein [Nitrospinae bacterium]|nr:UvrD-helicase domain-containing protein [Nitrospinota bacterium]
MTDTDILTGLNPAQREAVEAIQGPLLILAGPGSGKTRVITHRIAYLVQVCGVSPRRVMAVTFTNKAAREMKDRLYDLLGKTVDSITLGTFHSICVRILRVDGEPIGLPQVFASGGSYYLWTGTERNLNNAWYFGLGQREDYWNLKDLGDLDQGVKMVRKAR